MVQIGVLGVKALTAAALALPFGCNLWVLWRSRGSCSDEPVAIRGERWGLVLGCAPLVADGRRNLYFQHRVNAAARLLGAGRVERLLLSGDGRSGRSSEVQAMKEELVQRGLPPGHLHLDPTGLRTLDSVRHMASISRRFVVISQGFHNRRAVYLARSLGCVAQGFNAKDVGLKRALRMQLRETAARTRAVLEVVGLAALRMQNAPTAAPHH